MSAFASLLRRLCALAVATAGLAGCAALQVDVDVYKGPLANTDDTQVQQLASVALTAKPLISTMRNQLLQTRVQGTISNPLGYIPQSEWLELTREANRKDQVTRLDLQRAAQLNAALSFYDDRGSYYLDQKLEELLGLARDYERAIGEFDRALDETPGRKAAMAAIRQQGLDDYARNLPEGAKKQAYTRAQNALVRSWNLAVQLLDRMDEYWGGASSEPRSKLEQSLALLVSNLTRPGPCSELSRQGLTDNLTANAQSRKDAISKLRGGIDCGPTVGAALSGELIVGAASPRTRTPVTPPSVDAPLPTDAVRSPSLGTDVKLAAWVASVQRASEAYLADGSSGFDRGRPPQGIESLADALSRQMYSSPDNLRRSDKQNLQKAQKQLAQMLVDLAARMQFLATNLWLIDAGLDNTGSVTREQQETFKALLETVANTIMVQADELRVKNEYERRQQNAVSAELAAMDGSTLGRTGTQTLNPFGPNGGPGRAQDKDRGFDTPAEVVDAVIAQLEYRRIDALARTGGEAEARQLDLAINQARQRRAAMTFVRPSSAYLRSAFASTFAQTGTGLRWQNMLNDALGRAFSLASGEESRKDAIRDSLDKAYWQNINTVRVSAAGKTNYVLAKDDVGNWYVKAMGADPKAMVNAAKNMALFNAGGKFDANLLRMNQLQTQLDADTDETASQRRERWASELKSLQSGSTTVGAITERGTTINLFKNNYAAQTAKDFTALSASLGGLPDKVRQRWQLSLNTGDGNGDRRSRAEALLAAQTPSFTRVTTVMNATASSQADAIVATLQALNAYRSGLQAAVAGDTQMVKPELDALDRAGTELDGLEPVRAGAEQTMDAAQQSVTLALNNLAQAQASSPADAQLIDGLKQKLAAAQADQAGAVSALRTAYDQIKTARDKRDIASGKLAKARQEQAIAAQDVSAAISPVILEMVTRRLRAVQELETAANVVGRRGP